MIRRYPEPITESALSVMEVNDGGETWDWECEECWHPHREEGPLGEGDEMVCEKCGKKYRCV